MTPEQGLNEYNKKLLKWLLETGVFLWSAKYLRTLFLQNTGGCLYPWPDGEVLKLLLFLNWFEIKIRLIWKALEYENKSDFFKSNLENSCFQIFFWFFFCFYFYLLIFFFFFHFCFTRLIKFTNDNSRQPYTTFLKVH